VLEALGCRGYRVACRRGVRDAVGELGETLDDVGRSLRTADVFDAPPRRSARPESPGDARRLAFARNGT
jgi:hypothetical protein